jgi:hypothetical protein
MFLNFYIIIFKLNIFILIYLIVTFILIPAKPYFDEPRCTMRVDIHVYYSVTALVTTVFLKMDARVRNTYM